METDLLQSHAAFLMHLYNQDESVLPFLIQRIYYHTEILCGIIEVAPEADAETFRNRVIPMLELPVQLKALVNTDSWVPIVSAFTPQVYQAYSPEVYVNLLKIVNPLLAQEAFDLHHTVLRENGRQLYFRTTPTVLEFIRSNSYIIRHALGQTIFNRRAEYEPNVEIFTMMPSTPLDNSVPPPEPPSVDGDEVMKDDEQDPILPQANDHHSSKRREGITFSSQEIEDLLGPSGQPPVEGDQEEMLDYGLLEGEDDEDPL
jgi:hypothetical protein